MPHSFLTHFVPSGQNVTGGSGYSNFEVIGVGNMFSYVKMSEFSISSVNFHPPPLLGGVEGCFGVQVENSGDRMLHNFSEKRFFWQVAREI